MNKTFFLGAALAACASAASASPQDIPPIKPPVVRTDKPTKSTTDEGKQAKAITVWVLDAAGKG